MQASPSVTAISHYHHSTTTVGPKQASGQEIRSRLLRRLGIHEEEESMLLLSSSSSGESAAHQQQQQHRPAPQSFQVPLKYNNHNNSTNHNVTCNQNETKKSVGFLEQVHVVPIPMRCEYSERIKNRLYSSRGELHAMACRNLREFEFEGWNWRGVLGDEYMIISQEGELVHPVHCRDMLQQQGNNNNKWRRPVHRLTVQQQQQQDFVPPQQQRQQDASMSM